MKRTSYILSILISVLMITSCSQEDEEKSLCLNGVWELQEIRFPDDDLYSYPNNGITWLRIYDDSCYYVCQMQSAPTGQMIVPSMAETYTLIDKGNNEFMYLQGDGTHPLNLVDDSTVVIQENGSKYMWKKTDGYDEEKVMNIVGIIKNDIDKGDEMSHRYIFSYAERKLKTENDTLIYIILFIIVALMAFMNYVYYLHKNKERVEQELRRIEQEREAIPEPVRQAWNSVEEEFHKSDLYLSLRRRIANGERLKKDDWDAIEESFRSVYPSFSTTLMSLHNMSQVEYQVCVLLKLNVTPKEIANVLCKDKSSISSIRSRLYQKVFDKNGSGKDWDEFIYSL